MDRSRTDEERLDRLAGDEERGGGLPLPLLFAAILEELADNSSAVTARLAEVIADRAEFKADRVMEVWGSWDALCDDLLRQMAARRIIAQGDDGAWRTGRAFRPGANLVVVPVRPGKNRNPIGVTVYEREERERRGRAEEASMTVTEYEQRMRDLGLRPVSAKRADEIRDSIREFGDHRSAFPVLVDQNGNLLDGRHRRAVDPAWPQRVHPVESAEGMLQVMMAANVSHAWSRREWDDLAHLRRAVGGQQEKRERIRQALKEHPEASHNAIAKTLGVSPMTVGAVCAKVSKLETFPGGEQSCACRHGMTGQGARADRRPVSPGTDGEGRHGSRATGTEARNAEIVRLRDEEHLDWGEIGSRYGLKAKGAEDAYRKATGARDREPSRSRHAPLDDSATASAPTPPRQPAAHGGPSAVRDTGAESAWAAVTAIASRMQRFTARWRAAPPDPRSEREELREMRKIIDARLQALGEQEAT